MAFSFGNSSPFGSTGAQATFGSNPTRPNNIGFSTNFGSTAPTGFGNPPSTSFGAFGSTFNPSNTTPAVGFGTGFGTQPAATTPVSTFGNLFGPSGLTTSSAFGPTFGAQTSTGSSFGSAFPSVPTQNVFGSGTTKFNSFGTPTPTSNLFSTSAPLNLFTAPNQTTGWFGSSSTAPGAFGNSTALPSNPFGQNSSAQAPGIFGNNTGFGTSSFTQGQSAACPTQSVNLNNLALLPPSAIGHMYANPSLKEPLFYSKSDTNSTKLQQVYTSVYAINIFNDERDDILKKWNLLQACWGTGKGYYNMMMPPIDYTPETPFYSFRTMGYNRLPYHENSDGIVLLLFDKPYDELKNQEETLRNGIIGILGNKPYLTVDIIEIKSFNDTQTKVKIVVYEKSVAGFSKKVPASEMAAFLNQPLLKQQLSNAGTVLIVPVVTSSRIEVDEYLRKVPIGMDVQMWRTAVIDNPNPNSFIPILVNGFGDLHTRMLYQENQLALQQAFITKVKEDIRALRQKCNETRSRIKLKRHDYMELSHRVLKLLVKQERTRHFGCVMSPVEEIIQHKLQTLNQLLHHPKYFMGKIQDFLSNIRTDQFKKIREENIRFQVIPQQLTDQIMRFLNSKHHALIVMVKIVKLDLRTIHVILIDMDGHGLLPKQNFKKVEKYVPPKTEGSKFHELFIFHRS